MPALIRLATADDAADVRAIYAPIVETTAISFELEPPSVSEMARRITATMPRYPWLVCEAEGQVLGYSYAGQHHARAAYNWAVDVSVYVHEEARGRGVGRAMYSALLRILALQGFYTAYAGIALPNPGSVGLHEAVGFKPLGVYHVAGYKLGRWHDVGWWERPVQPLELEPAAPRTVDELLGTVAGKEAWERALVEGAGQVR